MKQPEKNTPCRIIYLDDEVLNSCNSQLIGGVEGSSTMSSTDSSSLGGAAELKTNVSAEGGINIPLAKFSGKGDASSGLPARVNNQTSHNRSTTICPYDNVHNALIERLSKDGLITTSLGDAQIGNIVNYSGSITIISKDMLSKFASNETIIQKFLVTKDSQQNEPVFNVEEITDTLKLLNILIPYDVFAKVDNSIVVLRKDSFRTGSTISPHMFGGDATVFGYVTNNICSTCIDEDNAFSQFISQINAALCQMLDCQEMKVICPISIYYK